MIPKVIHYCWFGGKPLPELALKCINSWKHFFPDYEIKEWNESNFNLECCDYVKEAYKEKKWAFVSDYVRFWVLYKYGGLYFDTDVEVIKDMKDIVAQGAFMGCEEKNTCNPGLGIGAVPGLSFYKEILDDYETAHFIKQDGTYNYMTVVDRTTNMLKKYNFKESNAIQLIKDIYIYPPEYFCPLDYTTGNLNVTENSRSIHWYDASWLDQRMQLRRKRVEKIRNYVKGTPGIVLSKLYMSSSYYWEWISTGDFKTIKQKFLNKVKRTKY